MESDRVTNAKASADQSDEVNTGITAPTITLPKGGGAIRGIGEKFAANPVTGTGSLTIPIATSPGRSEFGPQLSLSYDSGAGNRTFGLGWNLSLPSITRKTDKGLPKYHDVDGSDVFILWGGEDLVPVLVQHEEEEWIPEVLPPRTIDGVSYNIRRYRSRIEGLFARIERWTNRVDHSDSFWRSISKENITTWYGKNAESRIADPADPTHIFSWLICESYDDKGNVIVYGYEEENSDNVDISQVNEKNRTADSRSANRYLKRIRYSNHTPYFPELHAANPWPIPPGATAADASSDWLFEVVIDYGEHDLGAPQPNGNGAWNVRHDPISTYRPGFEVRTYRLCQRVLMFHHFPDEVEIGADCLVRSTDFNYRYEQDPGDSRNPIHTVLTSVTQRGYRKQVDGHYLKKAMPSVEFDYSQVVLATEIKTVKPDSLENLPYGADGSNYQWVDLDGEGLSGVLTEQGGAWFYKYNESPITRSVENGIAHYEAQLGLLQSVPSMPSGGLSGVSNRQFMDLAGDGQLDLVELDRPTSGFYERTHEQGWQTFRTFKKIPNIDWNDPNLKFIDLTGDGHADVLITENETLTWYESLAEAGFDSAERISIPTDEEQGPRVVFADAAQTIFQADLSGDGLTDIVRIRNGEVCYWPNLGYGRFGNKVSMDDAPWFDSPDQFNPRRIRLTDIDGSGVTDIIYLGSNKTQFWFNQSGNGWSAAQILEGFPPVDNIAAVTAVDLLGNGTACLVWSSPLPGESHAPMRYIELLAEGKPHLMIGTRNNLGAETRVRYAPSTYFYLEDKQAGKPWLTPLPFPVHVVERVETYDHISRNRFVTRSAYHHGFFDGVEREFRGFGMVEQWDTEEFAALSNGDAFPSGENIEESSHIPPVYTKTWFHTGIYLGRQRVSNFFVGLLDERATSEYYREPGLADDDAARLLLPDTVLPEGRLTIDEEREACRALKGAMLRQEVYALDGTDQESHPYTVTEQNFNIRMLQPMVGNPHGVFFSHAREALSYQYERNPVDPRISHTLTLAVDGYGNVLQSAAIGYGRRQPDPALELADQDKQAQLLMTCAENAYTDPVEEEDQYRAPVPSEAQSCELTGLTLAAGQPRFNFEQMLQAVQLAESIDYQQMPTDDLQKRIIEHVRTLYRRNDLSDALPQGQLQSLAIPFESYQLAIMPVHLTAIYGDRINDSLLSNDGRYVHSDGDTNWWIPSGRAFFAVDLAATPAEELAEARAHFFVGRRFQDPSGESATVDYDEYELLSVRTIDPLNNTVSAQYDYRVLQPVVTTDPNGNRAAVAFDTLGLVAGTALMAKETESLGDSLDGFEADLTQQQIDSFFAAPHGPIATALLGDATSRIVYDFTRFQRLGVSAPGFAATLARETHARDPLPVDGLKIQVGLVYSDGFGRIIQSKAQAEPGSINPDGAVIDPRWVGSGWTVFNNKGEPVKQYEPFFSASHDFEFARSEGVSPTLFYDPVGRVMATLHPNNTWEKIVFDAWRQGTWDVNDTVRQADPKNDPDVGSFFQRLPDADYLPTWYTARINGDMGAQEQDAANKTEAHADTPGIAYLDTLSRTFLSIADNGLAEDGTEQKFTTRVELDIEGNQRAVIDARGNTVIRYDYDMLGNPVWQKSTDAGNSWTFVNVMGNPVFDWKMALENETDDWQSDRDLRFRYVYDALHRPIESWITKGAESEGLTDKTVYGETVHDAESKNLRGQPFQTYDQAGLVENKAFDFKGNLLQSRRKLADEYKDAVDWNFADLSALLQDEYFESRAEFDALNRVVKTCSPHNPTIPASEIIPVYNEANLLNEVRVRLRGSEEEKLHIKNIDYDAKGQRECIRYGNDAITQYSYDPDTFRLIHLATTGKNSAILQDLHYTYDPVGNITEIRDDAQQTVFFANTQIDPHCAYTYDALYRLTKAEGREHATQNNRQRDAEKFDPIIGIPFANSPESLQRYVEEYAYDGVGNILNMAHSGGAALRWKRCYQYAQDSNRLLATGGANEFQNVADPCPAHHVPVPTLSQRYEYDAHGNMAMPHLTLMQWDYKDQLQASSKQVVNNGGTPETTYYVYDASGQRVRKITEKQTDPGEIPAKKNERIYLGGFELYREYGNGANEPVLERETLHIMDDQQRMALVEIRTKGDDDSPEKLLRYQLNNHLGSASLELDDNAKVISYEEYYPYGSSSYQAVDKEIKAAAKRYRYTGKERDDETGLYYYGARYYAAWLGRWVSCDPIVIAGGNNLYSYGGNNPLRFVDPDGRDLVEFVKKVVDPRRGNKRWKMFRIVRILIPLVFYGPRIVPVPSETVKPPAVTKPSEIRPPGQGVKGGQKVGAPPPPSPVPPVRLAGPDETRWRSNALKIHSRLPQDVIERLNQLREKLPSQAKPTTKSVRASSSKPGSGAVKVAGKSSVVQKIASASVSRVFAVGALAADAAPLFLMGNNPYWCEAAGPWVCGWSGEASKQMEKIRKEQRNEAFRQAWEEQMVETVGPEGYGLINFLAQERWLESQQAKKAGEPDPYPAMIKPEVP